MSTAPEQARERIDEHGEVSAILDTIEVATPKALEALNRAEIDMQIATAKRYPRSLGMVLREVETLATVDEETADKCFYRLKRENRRSGKTTWIVGPSVRFAEMVLCAWGNVRHGVQIIDTEGDFAVARATVHDLEKNGFHAAESVRQIVSVDKRSGAKRRYSSDLIQTTAMAAASIALRNATFRVIPIGCFKSILRKIDEVALGKSETMDARRAKVLEYFRGLKVSEDRVLSVCERKTVADLTVDDLINLRGLARAIKDGEATIEEAFSAGEAGHNEGARSAEARVMEALGAPKKPAEETRGPSSSTEKSAPGELIPGATTPELWNRWRGAAEDEILTPRRPCGGKNWRDLAREPGVGDANA